MLTDDELEIAIMKARAKIKNRYKRVTNELQRDSIAKELRTNLKKYLKKEKTQEQVESKNLVNDLRQAASELKKYIMNENPTFREKLR